MYPDIAKEWHPKKNKKLTPSDVTSKSNKTVWWICKKGHEWDASINKCILERGCSYRTGKNVC